jgi:hypothetical protein
MHHIMKYIHDVFFAASIISEIFTSGVIFTPAAEGSGLFRTSIAEVLFLLLYCGGGLPGGCLARRRGRIDRMEAIPCI